MNSVTGYVPIDIALGVLGGINIVQVTVLLRIAVDLAGIKRGQEDHGRRLNNLEDRKS